MILGELSKGLMFSLFAVGDVCLTSWTRHSLAVEKENTQFSAKMKTAKLSNAGRLEQGQMMSFSLRKQNSVLDRDQTKL